MVVVEVRQGTLGGDTRGGGPAGNTEHGWSWLKSGREQEERRRGEETRRGEEKRGEEEEEKEEDEDEEDEDEEDEEEATDIKSNNPHLAGGEQMDWCGTSVFFLVGHNWILYCGSWGSIGEQDGETMGSTTPK